MRDESIELDPATLQDLIRSAELDSSEIENGPEGLRYAFGAAPVVFGFWQDAEEPDGIGWMILKGYKHLRDHRLEGPGPTLIGLFFDRAEEAERARLEFGIRSEAH